MELYGLLLVISTFLLATYIFHEISNALFIKKKNLPPGPFGLPLIGSLITIRHGTHQSLAKLAKTYGPLMTIKLGFVNVVVASSAEMAKEILQKPDAEFAGRPIPDAVTAEKGYELAFPWLPTGRQWRKLRKIFNSHIFMAQKLDSLRHLRHDVVKTMVERVVEAQECGKAIYIGGIVFSTMMKLLSKMLFSADMLDPASDAMKELQVLNANIMVLVAKPNLADYFPFLRPFDPQGIRRKIRVSYDRLHELIDDMIDQRMKRRRAASERSGDLLDVLLDYTEHERPDGLTRLDVKLLIVEIFIAGTDTSTSTVEWVMAELLHNPTILSKTKQELSEIITPGGIVQEQDIARLPYLTAVIKETMRMHQTSPLLLPHQAEQDVEIQGYTIPKHTRIWVNAWSISRDATYWEKPTCFMPERFLNVDIDFRGNDFRFTPFSAGRRICPGMNLAVRIVALIVVNLVKTFDWKLPNGMAPEDMDMTEKFGVTLRKAEPLVAIPVRITT
ncbi:geraniol 8-hydroxylase-like [Sesamum indicum]|uniref:Geraniol 8-hydroxylase-like n=1 Tax=Sesamum indicum TaxID=4182 RepID=A0A6I9SQK4_SESIN|nr:geraniol 8-hydroxylase-like [Sesamum indicum]